MTLSLYMNLAFPIILLHQWSRSWEFYIRGLHMATSLSKISIGKDFQKWVWDLITHPKPSNWVELPPILQTRIWNSRKIFVYIIKCTISQMFTSLNWLNNVTLALLSKT